MCYLTIKEMANISEDVIIVTSRFALEFNHLLLAFNLLSLALKYYFFWLFG